MGNSPSSVPFGSSINLVNGTLTCNQVGGSYTVFIPFTLSATAPLEVAFAQNYTIGDLSATFSFSNSPFYSIEGEYGGPGLQVNTSITLSTTNAGLSTFTVTDVGYTTGFNVNPGLEYALKVPAQAPVFPPQGPISLYTGGGYTVGQLQIQTINFSVDYSNSQGQYFGPPSQYTCPGSSNPYIIATTLARQFNALPLPAANGFRAVFPTTLVGQKSSLANLQLNCNQNDIFNLTTGGTGPAIINATANPAVALTNFQNYFTIPPDLTQAYSQQYGPGTYKLRFNTGKNLTGADLSGPGIGIQIPTTTGSQIVDMARDFTPSDISNSRPLTVARNVQYNTSASTIFPLPLDGGLSYNAVAQKPYTFGVAVQSIQGYLESTHQSGTESYEENIICTVSTFYQMLDAPAI